MSKKNIATHNITELKKQLQEKDAELEAIREGDIDGVVIKADGIHQLYTAENTMLRDILESITDAFIAFDNNWRFTYLNKKAEELLGKKREEVLGKTVFSIFPNLKNMQSMKDLSVAMKNKTPISDESYSELFKRWIAVRFYPTKDGASMFMQDISERKMLEATLKQSEEYFRFFVEGASDYAMMILDHKGTIIRWNSGAEHLFGYVEKEVIGKNFSIFFTPPDKKKKIPQHELKVAIESGRATEEGWRIKKDGSRFWASGTTRAVYDEHGNLKGLVKIARDITLRMKLERQKDEFMSVASHELKTPVTSLKGYTQVLQKMLERKGDDLMAQHLSKMNGQINKLTNLIEDLLDVTKLEAGKLVFNAERFYFDDLVSEVVESMQLTTEKHTLIRRGTSKVHILGDRDRIGQVLTNLLSNAIKYSPFAKKIIITTTVKGGNVQVSVRDYGVGIPDEKMDQVFERFFRVSGPDTQTYPGLGLGLYISSEIIKRLGGRIWVTSSQGEGSTFYFSLPIKSKSKSN